MNIWKYCCALLVCAVPLSANPAHFNLTGNMTTARGQHSATLLLDGKILFVGGDFTGGTLTSADLYDPATGLVTATGSLSVARQLHTATLLPDGRVLVAGGTNGAALSTAEIYDPATGNWTLTGSLGAARYLHTATLLNNGLVLIAGGQGAAGAPLDSAELYDPATGQFTATGPLSKIRQSHTATLLPGGKVLIAGGIGSGGTLVRAAELYDPSLGSFGSTANILTLRYLHTATLLTTGKVLIAGGFSGSSTIDSAEIYDPAGTGTFTATGSMTSPRYAHVATLLPNGKVLIAGGYGAAATLSTAELYDPAGSFTATLSMATERIYATATLVPTGSVIVAGGQAAGGVYLASTERYDASTAGTFSATGAMDPRNGHSATLLADGKVLIAGGDADYYFLGPTLSSALLFDYVSGTFTPTGSLNAGRSGHTGTLLTSGKVLIAGGTDSSGWVTSAELYDPVGGTFGTTGALITQRTNATATLLANGKVLIAGGVSGVGTRTASAELYDPLSGSFANTGSMSVPRSNHTATLLPNGTVLMAGGFSSDYTAAAEVYNPLTGLFSPVASMNNARSAHTATLLASGKVLIAGGDVNQLVNIPTEIYDPAAFSFSLSASLTKALSYGIASVLPNGKVLLAGGYADEGVLNPSPGSLWYDPIADFTAAGPSLANTNPRTRTATMLPNGTVLVTGTPAAELYDCGIGYADPRRPVITTAPSAIVEPAAISLTGSGFRGDSEGSGGGYNSSAANIPLLLLQRVDNNQLLTLGAGSPFSSSSFTSTIVSGLANGHYRMRIVVNGISSVERLILITGDPTIASITPDGGPAAGGQPVTITGTNLGGTLSIGGVVTSYTGTPSSITFTSPAHATGPVDVTVTTLNGKVTVAGGYTYFPLPTPSGFSAAATSTSEVSLNWSPSSGASGYEVWRSSSLLAPYVLLVTVSGNSATDTGLSADTSYLYKVRATGAGGTSAFTPVDPATTTSFTDPAPAGVVFKAVHIVELRTAVNAMRAAAGLTAGTLTDLGLTAGMLVKRSHLIELRTALDAARTAIGLPAMAYTDPTITAQSTVVKAVHLTQLRAATQ